MGLGIILILFLDLGRAAEEFSITLELPPKFFSQLCPQPLWNHPRVIWQGVKDKRPNPALGTLTKKHGKDPTSVFSQPSLEEIFNRNLEQLFRHCGMDLMTAGSATTADDFQLSGFLEEFYAQEEKGIFTGKGRASSRLLISAIRPQKKINATVTYQIEFKMGRKRGIERLEKILQELFENTVKQVTLAPQLKEI